MSSKLRGNVKWMTMSNMEGKLIPEEYRAALVELTHDEHNLSAAYHNEDRAAMTVRRAKEMGVYDWLITRSPQLWGTPRDISSRLEELGEMGVTNWLFYAGQAGTDKLDLINKLSSEVMPNFA